MLLAALEVGAAQGLGPCKTRKRVGKRQTSKSTKSCRVCERENGGLELMGKVKVSPAEKMRTRVRTWRPRVTQGAVGEGGGGGGEPRRSHRDTIVISKSRAGDRRSAIFQTCSLIFSCNLCSYSARKKNSLIHRFISGIQNNIINMTKKHRNDFWASSQSRVRKAAAWQRRGSSSPSVID